MTPMPIPRRFLLSPPGGAKVARRKRLTAAADTEYLQMSPDLPDAFFRELYSRMPRPSRRV